MEELKVLMKAYKEEVGQAPELLGVALSSRKNLCIHPEVSEGVCGVEWEGLVGIPVHVQVSREEGKLVDSKCHSLTASFQRKKHQKDSRVPTCSYYEVCV